MTSFFDFNGGLRKARFVSNELIRNLVNIRSRHGGSTGVECIATLTLRRSEFRRGNGALRLPIGGMEALRPYVKAGRRGRIAFRGNETSVGQAVGP